MKKFIKSFLFCFASIFISVFYIQGALAKSIFVTPKEMDPENLMANNPSAETTITVKRPKISYSFSNLKDPFKPPVINREDGVIQQDTIEKVQLPELSLQGVIWGGLFPQAIINNKVTKVGDFIEGAEVISISKDGVKLFFANAEHFVPAPAGTGRQEQGKIKEEK